METLALIVTGMILAVVLFLGWVSLFMEPFEDLTEEEQLRELDEQFESEIREYQLRNRIRNLRCGESSD